jgi:hypothetical protein
VCKTDAAFEAACTQNITTGFAGHALEKAVFASAMTLFWLVCTFWHNLKLSLKHRFI